MNEQPIIRFENVNKQFTYSQDKPQTILETLISPFRRSERKKNKQYLWAVNDVSFDIFPGQSVGIVGRNGSGKSTVLKLATRIIKPTSGRIWVNGRVSALLELGAGFHPDLTGRDNIYLNASLLGLSKNEVDYLFDDIVDFSELGNFINMPVKHYSSGMYMRLGFSVAIHIHPDILIIDEILAVGDQAFQSKCLDRIYEMKSQGVTFIMVSHNLGVIRRMCSHLVWLEDGKMKQAGLVDDVAKQYQADTYQKELLQMKQHEANSGFKRMGNGAIEITAVRISNQDGIEEKTFEMGACFVVEMNYFAHKPIPNPEIGLAIHRYDGLHVNGTNTRISGLDLGMVEGAGVVRYSIPKLPLTPSRYFLTASIHDSRYSTLYDYHEQAYPFRVIVTDVEEPQGIVEIPAIWDWMPET